MSDNQDGGRPATARRRQEARQQGQVARSRELVFAILFGVCLLLLLVAAPRGWLQAQHWLRQSLREPPLPGDPTLFLQQLSGQWLARAAMMLLPCMLTLTLAVVIGHWVQHGPLWVPQRVMPDVQRLAPSSNWQRVCQQASIARLLLWTVKLILLAGIAYALLDGHVEALWAWGQATPAQISAQAGQLGMRVACWLGLGLLVSAALDFAWQLWRYEQSLAMSAEAMRDELKAVQNDVSHFRRRPGHMPQEETQAN